MNTNFTNSTLTIVGYEKCPYFYKVCLFGAICKKRKKCADYLITSFATVSEYTKWLEAFIREHPQTRAVEMNASPFVYDEEHTYFGGYSEMFALMQDVVVPDDEENKQR